MRKALPHKWILRRKKTIFTAGKLRWGGGGFFGNVGQIILRRTLVRKW